MGQIRIRRLSVGSGSRTAVYDERTCPQPLYAEHLGQNLFKVTLTDGNYYHSGDPSYEGQFEMDTAVSVYSGYVQEQMPGIGLPETIILTLIAE